MTVKTLTAADFEETIVASPIALVDFWAPGAVRAGRSLRSSNGPRRATRILSTRR